jgi:hypothetical protein
MGHVEDYNLATILLDGERRPCKDSEEAVFVVYAPIGRRMLCIVGILAAGRSVHPQGPIGAMSSALYIVHEHAIAIEAGWSLNPEIVARSPLVTIRSGRRTVEIHQAALDLARKLGGIIEGTDELDAELVELGAALRMKFGTPLEPTPREVHLTRNNGGDEIVVRDGFTIAAE